MNMKKILVMGLALLAATCVFARPHGCGPRGGWGHHGGWGGPRYHGGWGYRGGWGYHHHHCGLGLAAGIVGLTAATAAIAHDVIAPPVVYSAPAVYPATYAAPVATTYAAPVATYPVAAPTVVTPAPVVYPATTVVYPRAYRRWCW